jgi:hypothetical protein
MADASGPPVVVATVYEPDGTATTASVSAATLQADPQQCPAYPAQPMQEMGAQGSVNVPLASASWGMGSILQCLLGSQASSVQGVIVINTDGTPEDASGDELQPADWATPSSDFTNSSEVPVVGVQGSSIQYDRPYRGSGDLDFADHISETAPLQIEIFEGPLLTVTPHLLEGPLLSSSSTTVTTGTTVSLSAVVSGQGASNPSYDWTFDGAAGSSSQPSPQVTFNMPGVYALTVQVTDSAGGGGAATVMLTVNPPGGAPAPAKGHKHQKGYGSRGSKRGKATGPLQSNGHGGSTAGGSTGSGTGAAHQTTTAARTAAPTTPTSTTDTTAPHVAATATPPNPHREHFGRRAPRGVIPPVGTVVQGRVIGGVATQSAPAMKIASAASGAPAPIRRAISASAAVPLSAAGGALAVLTLLALGAGWELRGRRWRGVSIAPEADKLPAQSVDEPLP